MWWKKKDKKPTQVVVINQTSGLPTTHKQIPVIVSNSLDHYFNKGIKVQHDQLIGRDLKYISYLLRATYLRDMETYGPNRDRELAKLQEIETMIYGSPLEHLN